MSDDLGEGGAGAGSEGAEAGYFGVDEAAVAENPQQYAEVIYGDGGGIFGTDESAAASGDGYEYKYLDGEAGFGSWDDSHGGDSHGVKLGIAGENAEGADGGHNIVKVEAAYYVGEHEAGLSVQATAYENYGKIGELDPTTSGDDLVKLGYGFGAGAGVKGSWDTDRDGDGYKEVSFGLDAGPLTFEYTSEEARPFSDVTDSTAGQIQEALADAQVSVQGYDYAGDSYAADPYAAADQYIEPQVEPYVEPTYTEPYEEPQMCTDGSEPTESTESTESY